MGDRAVLREREVWNFLDRNFSTMPFVLAERKNLVRSCPLYPFFTVLQTCPSLLPFRALGDFVPGNEENWDEIRSSLRVRTTLALLFVNYIVGESRVGGIA